MAEILEEKLDRILEELRFIRDKLTNEKAPDSDTLTAEKAANYLQISRVHLYRLKKQKKIKPIQRGRYGKILFQREELNRYLKSIEI